MAPFMEKFPELAARETRSVPLSTLLQADNGSVAMLSRVEATRRHTILGCTLDLVTLLRLIWLRCIGRAV